MKNNEFNAYKTSLLKFLYTAAKMLTYATQIVLAVAYLVKIF
jgi:hypothetical protein